MNGNTIQSREVFISSTTSDLAPYRVVAQQVIDELNDEFIGRFSLTGTSMMSEPLSGERETEVEASRGWVAKANWIVLIVAWNYGFVPATEPGKPAKPLHEWEPCSVTEWEYWEAVKVSQPPKKCFVFIAGDENDGDLEYWPLEKAREPVNLMKFKGTSKHADQLASFRNTLKAGRPIQYKLFSNIEHFRQGLKTTLRKKIEKELHPPESGPDLESVVMITGLMTPLRECIDVVKTITTIKRMHDRLHKIRQWGILRWREEVLQRWEDGSEIPLQAERTSISVQKKVYRLIGELSGFFYTLAGELQAPLHSVLYVIKHFDIDDDSMPDRRNVFEKSIDLFAGRVQEAFTACNWQMVQAAAQLRLCHGQLADKSREALRSFALKPAERDLLRDELNHSKQLHERLQDVLKQHNSWQRVHDRLQRVDNERDRELFEMVIMPVIDGEKDILNLMVSATALVNAGERSAAWSVLIENVQRNLTGLMKHPDETAYDAMRKAFDVLFFEVDIETLETVEESQRRSTAIEEKLRGKEREFDASRAEAAERRRSGT